MPAIEVFAACQMRNFAGLVSRQLGVQVRLRGREICVRYGKPPVIFLPAMEHATKATLDPLFGFCLHEAGHLAYTQPKVARKSPNYLVKSLHNAIEDELIERRLERKFPGAREMLEKSYADATKMMPEGRPLVDPKSWLDPGQRDEVRRVMSKLGLDADDEGLADEVAKRLEIDRVAKLWIVEKRRYVLPLHDWPTHPWREAFERETEPRAKSTKEAYAQALRIIERLGIKPVLPGDARPVQVLEEAKAKQQASREARKALREALRERQAEIKKLCERSREHSELREAKAKADEARGAMAKASEDEIPLAEKRLHEAETAEKHARGKYAKKYQEIKEEVAPKFAAKIEALAEEAKRKASEAKAAVEAAKKAIAEIKKGDAIVDAPIGRGVAATVIERQFEAYRDEGLSEELGEAMPSAADAEAAAARHYCVHDRSHDRVDRMLATPQAMAAYEKSRLKYQRIISETTERLRRLYSPQKTRLRTNAEAGRLDQRKAYKLGLATRGVAVDVARVWRSIEVRTDPKVAVSLLLDCSGSMYHRTPGGEARIELARQAAACLSEVMTNIGLPHEIVGHTTLSGEAEALVRSGEINPHEIEHFSRLVPFRGYVFKPFEEKTPTAAVFADFDMEDNLDGEAVLWAVKRLAARREKTKVCIVISDGSPNAMLSNTAELDRHLYSVCKQVEAREGEGLFLFGLGIGEERVRRFYKNADVLARVEDLPRSVLGLVERVLAGIGRR